MKTRIAKKILKGIFDNSDYIDCIITNIGNGCYELSEFCHASNIFKNYNFRRNNKQTVNEACKVIIHYKRNKNKHVNRNKFKSIIL